MATIQEQGDATGNRGETTARIEVGDTFTGSLAAGGDWLDNVAIELVAGTTYEVEMSRTSGDLAPGIVLHGPGDSYPIYVTLRDGAASRTLIFTAEESGRYEVQARHVNQVRGVDEGAGDYALTVRKASTTKEGVAEGDAGRTVMQGTEASDLFDGGGGDDWINGWGGADRLDGGQGADTMRGGHGDDTLDGGAGGDWIHGGAGVDKVDGGQGADTIRGGYGEDTVAGGSGNDWIRGGTGADRLEGGQGDDTIRGGHGDDVLDGGDGNDWMRGGRGADTVHGGAGNDSLLGGRGRDTLEGGRGDDVLHGGMGENVLTGGPGADTFVFRGGKDRITDFNAEEDSIDLRGQGMDLKALGAASHPAGEDLHIMVGGGEIVLEGGAGISVNEIDFKMDDSDYLF